MSEIIDFLKLVLVVANYATYDFFANKLVCMDLTALY